MVSGVLGNMIGVYKRKKFPDCISLKDPILRNIYQEIVEYNPAVDKMKPQKMKVQKT